MRSRCVLTLVVATTAMIANYSTSLAESLAESPKASAGGATVRTAPADTAVSALPDGAVGCLFERDNYSRISWCRFTLDWLEAAAILGPVTTR